MKVFLTIFGLVACLYTSTSLANSEEATPGSVGLTRESSTKEMLNYKFKDEIKYSISKSRFNNRVDAIKFCSANKMQLGDAVHILLLAMSGLPLTDSELKAALVFNFEKLKVSGVGAWISDKELTRAHGDIFLIYDGRGMEAETGNLADLNKGLDLNGIKPLTLPAICVNVFKNPF